MKTGCYIGIDQGSSSTKAVALGIDGVVLAEARRDLSPPLREGPRIEQDPGEILRSLRSVIDAVVGDPGLAGKPVLGAGLSCQRSSCLVWDPGTGAPLSPVLSWRDTRGRALVDGLAPSAETVFERTGLPLNAYYSASKLRWLLDAVPEARKEDAVLGTLSSFLCQRLTGATVPLIDHTHAARTLLMDIRSLAWSRDLIGLFGLSGARLPEIVPTGHDFGPVDTPAGPVPLRASIGDQQAALLGLGILCSGQGGINYGTGGFLMVNTGPAIRMVPGLMTSVFHSGSDTVSYLVEGSVHAAGDGIDWVRTHLGLVTGQGGLERLCRTARTEVVVFLGVNGTGAPHWEREIESGLCGMTADSTAADIVRGAVEGIAFFVADIAGALDSSGMLPEHFTVSGGLSSLSYLVEAQAALLDRPLAVSSAQETSALGAALLAGMHAGTWTERECRRFTAPARPVTPLADRRLRERYRRWHDLHRFLSRTGR